MAESGIAALRRAKTILGTEVALAIAVGVRQPSVHYMLNRGKRVPAEWCRPIENATRAAGEAVTCHELRPDIFPPPNDSRSAQEAA